MKPVGYLSLAALCLFLIASPSVFARASAQAGASVGYALDAGDPVIGAEFGGLIHHARGQSFIGAEFIYLRDTETIHGIRAQADLYSFLATYRYYFWPAADQNVRWYIGGGFGSTEISVDVRGIASDSDTAFTFHIGGGAEFEVADNVNLRVGLRFINYYDVELFGATFDSDDLIVELGLNFRF